VDVSPIGPVLQHPDVDEWYMSEPYELTCLRGHACRFVLEGYLEDTNKDDFHIAIQNFIDLSDAALRAVEPHVFQYCLEMLGLYDESERPLVLIERASDVWRHIQFGSEMHVARRADGDEEDGIYFLLECSCDWEQEHGLLMVVRDGLAFTKVGPYDGHLTNSDAYADPTLKGVVFKSFR
jgi:hypothetical protein